MWIVLKIFIGLQYSLDFLHVVYFFCLVMQFFCSKSIVEWNWNVVQQKKSSSLLKSEISRALLQNILVCHKLVCFEDQVPFEDASDQLPLSEWTTENNKRQGNPATNNFLFWLFMTYNWRIRPDWKFSHKFQTKIRVALLSVENNHNHLLKA